MFLDTLLLLWMIRTGVSLSVKSAPMLDTAALAWLVALGLNSLHMLSTKGSMFPSKGFAFMDALAVLTVLAPTACMC
jgi:hypothetical protein